MQRPSAPTRIWIGALALAACAGCRHEPAREDVEHVGFRSDIPDDRRGNAVFEEAWWSDDGTAFVTRHHMGVGLGVWDAEGRLITHVQGQSDDGFLVVDGLRRRLVARSPWTPIVHSPPPAVFDLDSGAELFAYPDDVEHPAALWGRTDGGAAVVLGKPGRIEVWSLDAPELLRSGPNPLPEPYYGGRRVVMSATYHDRNGWEISPSGRWLALHMPEKLPAAPPVVHLVDLTTLDSRALALPPEAAGRVLECFAFDRDDARLAVGTNDGLWIHDLLDGAWTSFTPGRNRRNAYLGPLGFSADGTRVVALGDQGQIVAIQASNGAWLGDSETDFEDWEAGVRLSADGSRVVRYLFVSDVLEVLDGADARTRGWVCPYFCNVKHNPVSVAFAPSPDGTILAASHRYGAALWSFDDRLLAPLVDPALPPVRSR
jgi:hypothetical protein